MSQCRRLSQRSSARSSASTDEGDSWSGSRFSGAGSSLSSPTALSISPAARSRSKGGASGKGVSNATGRPRSVTSMVSPASTRRRYSLALCLSSRIPILTIVLHIAHRLRSLNRFDRDGSGVSIQQSQDRWRHVGSGPSTATLAERSMGVRGGIAG